VDFSSGRDSGGMPAPSFVLKASSTFTWFEDAPNEGFLLSEELFGPRLALLIRFGSLSMLMGSAVGTDNISE
jgi:hypothetical protein